ncbi:MAG: DegT/DnrJ/EryC1/StrS family aminotransferase [Candidatus Omnitrophica bacterium]|nr:DegT/DnrJ/EryC1/StrS family aminotransferase [Candidatus Omnitrophota bacterium]
MDIPFVDLKIQYQSNKQELDKAIQGVLDESAFILGKYVEQFERNFANYCGVKHCIGVGSGTDALHLGLRACGVAEDDEVIVPVNTFIATAEAVSHCGAVPVFVDIDEETFHVDIDKIEEKISSKTKVIIPVHLYGQPVDMDKIMNIAKRYGLKVVEDACQAHGATYNFQDSESRLKAKRAGSMGDVGCFSFYPGKNLGAYGDGGAVVTDNDEVADKVKLLRNHGEQNKYNHLIVGYCSRLHALQAAILNVKLKKLDEWNGKRRKNALSYNRLLKDLDVIIPYVSDRVESVYHLYVIRVRNRDKLREILGSKGIAAGIHYPVPLHLQPAYKHLGYNKGDFPVAEAVAEEILSLPMYPELSREQIEYVIEQIRAVVS